MIKLNNKNITYVALADSNNSLKAPKEIWYADSSNSVKLVYRRKDALIEGEDYEKYHWLCGRNGAYINTNHKFNAFEDSFQIKAKIDDPTAANPNGGENDIFGYMQDDGYRCIAFYARGTGRLYFAYSNISSGGNQIYFENKTDFIATLSADGSNFTATCDGVAQIAAVGNLPQGEYGDITIFRFGQIPTSANYFHGDISYFNIEPNKIRMIPCKLLKPVPKWLDANGIRRQVGECGMIALISGKFYGNVNSVGTFTVENYYERKEWLVGDGSAYIDTKVTSYTGVVSTKYSVIESELNDSNAILGRERADYTIDDWSSRLVFELNKSTGRLVLYSAGISWIQYLTTDTIDVDVVNDTFTTSTQSGLISVGDNVVGRNLFLFATNDGAYGQRPLHGKVAYLRISDKLNLIPCTLTMDLPASMDANNIARTKGTSGMWDLVSDRFYGNVASSGTFKAVNLAEGVDYEVHQWLKGDLNSYIQLDNHYNTDELAYIETVAQLYDNSNPLVAIIIGNNNSDDNGGYCLRMTFYNPNDLCDAHRRGNGHQDSVRNSFNNDYGVHTYYLSLTDFIVDGVSYPFTYGSRFDDIMNAPYTRVIFGTTKFNSIKLRTNNTTFSLIPVKLLRSIPSKYDANGIARQVGECGMYDTVNDVFYGNVSNRGSFSVEDN